MYYLGIDIGKEQHSGAIIDSEGKIIVGAFTFNSNLSGYQKLIKAISTNVSDKTQLKVGLEATGHYWLNIYEKLKQDGFNITVLNPLQVCGFRNQGIRGTKTDNIDSILIARIIRFGETIDTKLANENILVLKQLTRYRANLVDQCTTIKNKVICLLDQVFPEYKELFSDIFGSSSLELLKEASTPEEVLALDNRKLIRIINKASRGKFEEEKANEIKEQARNSFGLRTGSDGFGFQIKLIISQLEHIAKIIRQLELKISQLYMGFNLKLTSIPGIGINLAATIISEIEDVSNFKHPKGGAIALVAYAGLDPRVQESGKFKGHAKMSKRGSPYLRRAIYQASFVASQIDDRFKSIYVKQRNKGKSHKVALSHVARKMLHVIHSILKYDKHYISLNQNC